MRLLVEENHDLPLVRVQIGLRSGAADDPVELDGLCNFATELMARGAAGKDRATLDRMFDGLGTNLDVIADLDAAWLEVTVLRDKLEPVLSLLADVLLRPDFPVDEADKLRREIGAQLDELRDDDGQLARRYFGHALYGAHPYGRTIIGTSSSLPHLDVAQARGWHQRVVRADNLLVGLAGDLGSDEAEALVHKHLGAIPPGGTGGALYPLPPRRQGRRLTLVDKPDRTQSQILWGQPGPKWGEPDYFSLQVSTCAYGGTFTARLMNEVRSKRGLSYGASARLGQGRGARALAAAIAPSLDQTAEALGLVLQLHRDWIESGITQEELDFAKGYLQRSFAFTVSTPEDRLDLRASLDICGLPREHGDRFVERIGAVTLEQTREAQARHLSPNDLEICIVCTVDDLRPKLEAAGLLADTEVVVTDFEQY